MSTAPRRRALFVAEAVTLAHVVRLVSLASALQREGWDVLLATDPRYAPLVGTLTFPTLAIQTMPAARFRRAITRGSPIFDFATLNRYVSDELALLDRVRPDVVVGDFRISLAVSARLAGVRYVNLTNAYWSPLARIRQPVPEFDWVRWVGRPLAQALFDRFRRAGYARHAEPVNRLRRKYGLPGGLVDFRDALVDGDLTCFADLPEIVPTAPLPPQQRYIGPVPWSPAVALPPWWPSVLDRRGRPPLVYVNLGSSGPPAALQQVLDALAGVAVDVVAATAGQAAAALRVPANARVATLLPGDVACQAAELVVCNGGSPATYQALAHGKPVVGVASNMDQFLNMAAVEDAGCGVLLRAGGLSSARVREALARCSRAGGAAGARRIAQAINLGDAGLRFAGIVADHHCRGDRH